MVREATIAEVIVGRVAEVRSARLMTQCVKALWASSKKHLVKKRTRGKMMVFWLILWSPEATIKMKRETVKLDKNKKMKIHSKAKILTSQQSMVHPWACSKVGGWVHVNLQIRWRVRKMRIRILRSKCLQTSRVFSKLSIMIPHPSKVNSDKKLPKVIWREQIREACLILPFKCKRTWISATIPSYWLKDHIRLSPQVKWHLEGENGQAQISLWYRQVLYSKSMTRVRME